MSKYILNLSTIQQGHKIQLIKEVREKWDDRAKVGDKVAFFEDDDGRIIIEPTGRPEDESE